MVLVAILPALMVFVGLTLVTGGAYWRAALDFVFHHAFLLRPPDPAEIVPWLVVVAYSILPYALVPFLYLFVRDRRRQAWSAAAVFLLPLYLAGGWLAFDWPMGIHVPAAVMIATLTAWLAAGRLTLVFRSVALTMVLLGLAVSWSTVPSATILSSPGQLIAVGE